MASHSLILDSIIVQFGQKPVLHGVYLALTPGSVCGLYGLNGSGKSTLMKVVMGTIVPASGTVFMQDIPLGGVSIRERFKRIAYLPQGSFVPPDITVDRVIRQFPGAYSLLNDFAHLGHAGKTVAMLSTGWRRYLEIRLVLSLDRSIVLLDEPFTGLEPVLIERVVKDIRGAKHDGRTILLTDHYHQYVEGAVDDRVLLSEGRCRTLSSSEDVIAELSRGRN